MKKNILPEVAIIRPTLILLLVTYHSFAPWCGSWSEFEGFVPNESYKLIARLAYSFMLPMFVFISGYVWSYQRESLNKIETFENLLKKKLKRLYVPSLIFSTLYIIAFDFKRFGGGGNYISLIKDISSGYAHLWFLPMLLWCFMISYPIINIKTKLYQCVVVFVLWFLSVFDFPLQLSSAFYFLLYFFIGYNYRNFARKVINITSLNIVILWLIYAIVYISMTLLNRYVISYFDVESVDSSIVFNCFYNFIRTSYGIIGVVAMFMSARFIISRWNVPSMFIMIGDYCMGVYIFQQFVLHYLYYCTELPLLLGSDLLPWIALIITIALSLLLSIVLRSTYWGRQLV